MEYIGLLAGRKSVGELQEAWQISHCLTNCSALACPEIAFEFVLTLLVCFHLFVHSEIVPERSCIDLGQPEGHTEQLMLRWGSPTSVLSGTGRGSRTRLQRCTCSRVVGGLSDSGINVTAAGEIWGPWGYYWAH